ncbi:unnamed protein product [Diatraea saccharalis]|uniref:Uncharacterized protein n=1 Tax=Diatraea saccharalis TaxID=40085 RepID=A0A9N9QUD2_9NEOP|nr:unnamed protein product [Diatraea saccharalis]
MNNISTAKFDESENGPARVEVYYFERGPDEYLATSEAGAAPPAAAAACERWARRGARLPAPLPAAGRLLCAVPLALLVALERCALTIARDAVTGVVQTASDYALKPALTLAFNALLQPPLAFAANVGRALRGALRPLALALGDATRPVAALLREMRLVAVHCDRGRAADV